jgi:hypothetical protein
MVIAFRIVPLRSRKRLSDPLATFFAKNKKSRSRLTAHALTGIK